jgi:hypothetical protein
MLNRTTAAAEDIGEEEANCIGAQTMKHPSTSSLGQDSGE